jgi:hypothetical protein
MPPSVPANCRHAVHLRQDVAAGRQLDVEALRPHVDELGERMHARPDEADDAAARALAQAREQALGIGGEVGGVAGRVLLRDDARARPDRRQRRAERRDAVAPERGVEAEHADRHVFVRRDRRRHWPSAS